MHDKVVTTIGKGQLFIQLTDAISVNLDPARLQDACKMTGPIADDKCALRLEAHEIQTLDDVIYSIL